MNNKKTKVDKWPFDLNMYELKRTMSILRDTVEAPSVLNDDGEDIRDFRINYIILTSSYVINLYYDLLEKSFEYKKAFLIRESKNYGKGFR